MTRYFVHTVAGSPYGRAVMAMLEEKGADWQIAPLDPAARNQMPHLARQPFGKMPALEFDGEYLYETQAILRYLDEALPGASLTPAGLRDRTRMNVTIGVCDAYLFPESARIVVFNRVIAPAFMPGFVADEEAVAAAMPRSHTVFAELSRHLGEREWFGGDAISLADLMIGPQLELFHRAPEWAELTAGRENLVRWLERIEARPSMTATLWERLNERVAEMEPA